MLIFQTHSLHYFSFYKVTVFIPYLTYCICIGECT